MEHSFLRDMIQTSTLSELFKKIINRCQNVKHSTSSSAHLPWRVGSLSPPLESRWVCDCFDQYDMAEVMLYDFQG